MFKGCEPQRLLRVLSPRANVIGCCISKDVVKRLFGLYVLAQFSRAVGSNDNSQFYLVVAFTASNLTPQTVSSELMTLRMR